MKNSRLGCLTATGVMAAVMTILIIAGFALASGGTLFSPGALNAQTGTPLGGTGSSNAREGAPLGGISSHAEIAGQCNLCHTPFWSIETMADKCVTCHTDVKMQWQDPTTLHGTLRQNNPNLACRDCHPDHRGSDSPLIDLTKASFPHTSFGFRLTAHQIKSDGSSFSCNNCHSKVYTSFDQNVCITCHYQMNATFLSSHVLDLGTDCLACHDGVDSYGHNFNHNDVAFQLTGVHAQVGCAKCHVNTRTMAVLKATPQNCDSCHTVNDVHQGRLGSDCISCHTTIGWTPATYDHNLSIFKLTGTHKNVACADCHVNQVLQGTPTDCNSCHASKDVHASRLGTDCGSCHTTDGWTPATYNHDLSAFKLTGQHISVACSDCHVNNVLQGTPTNCYTCHAQKDSHQGALGKDCGTCHNTAAWNPAFYDHNLSTFKLTGQHTTTSCLSCHANNIFKGTPSDCNSCHAAKDIHSGNLGKNCGSCHSTTVWKPANFDHNLATFKLTGQHVTTGCTSCHPNNVFWGSPTDCFSCHASKDAHSGQLGSNCGQCHSTSAWQPATFDHNSSSFKLTGKHASVACTSCHVNNVFKGTPTNCSGCHATKDPHSGQFGNNCGSCHSTNGWLPATFDHNLSSFKLTGAHVNVNCDQCHTDGNYSGISSNCVACHAEPAGHFGSNCVQCHTTNNWNASYSHTSFALTGAHSSLGCSQCHANGSYTGLSATCASCHAEPSGHFGSDCASCHTTNNWNASYSHSGFPLTGAHSSLGCTQCHTNGGFTGLSSSCISCHAEPGGHFGSNCAQCHTTNNWNATYSHSGFPLTGAHSSLACSQCHTGSGYSGLSSGCVSCHSAPSGHYGSNCTQCHTTSNWNSSFSHPNSCGGSCTNHHRATCADCHPSSNYSSSDCRKCHDSNNPHG
jgi:hypothetical protein